MNTRTISIVAATAAGLALGALGVTNALAATPGAITGIGGKCVDVAGAVTVDDFRTILAYAQQHHIARFSYWSQNRDRPCAGGYPNDDTCSGVSQAPWDYTRVVAQYRG